MVAFLTLLPAGVGDPTPFWCLPCGYLGSADAVLNTVLFMPLGAVFGALGLGSVAAAGAGFGVSALIELAQTAVPGRYPTFGDVVVNGGGAVLGLLLWHRFVRGLPSIRVWAVVGGAGLAATALVSIPTPPDGVLYGQYTPRLGSFDAYDGAVIEARLGGVSVASGPLADTEAVRGRLRGPEPVRVTFRVGTPTRGWAPVFAIFSADREEALFLGVRGDDVLLRVRSLAGALRFAEPSMVLYDGLAGLAPGDTAVVSAHVERAGICLETAGSRACGLGPGPLEGWRFLRRDLLVPLPWTWLSAAMVAFLSAMMLLAGDRRTAWTALAVLSAVALALPAITPLASLGIPGLLLGLAGGAWVARIVERRRTRTPATAGGDPPDPGVP